MVATKKLRSIFSNIFFFYFFEFFFIFLKKNFFKLKSVFLILKF